MTPLQRSLTGLTPLKLNGDPPPGRATWILFLTACLILGGIILHGLLGTPLS